MQSNYKRLGDFIEQSSLRNRDLHIDNLLGINIDKYFMPSVANIIGTDLSNYKIVKKGQFACNRMHVGRDYRIPIALSREDNPFIVSPAYDVFEIKNTDILNEDYLDLWFKRKEFDRNAWFYTDADVRGGLSWEAFSDMKIPVPSIEKQQAIVEEYNTIERRIELNNKLIEKLEETAQTLYKHWFVDFEFLNEEGKPYKSSGGKMVYNEELEKEIPKDWEVGDIKDILDVKYGKDYKHLTEGTIPLYGSGGLMRYVNQYLYNEPSILIPRKGSLNNIMYVIKPFWSVDTMFYTIPKVNNILNYAFYFFSSFDFSLMNTGSAVPSMTTEFLNSMRLIIPDQIILEIFKKYINIFTDKKLLINQKNKLLISLKDLLLSRLATLE